MQPFRRTNFSGWLITNRTELLHQLHQAGIDPVYHRLFAEHVTYRYPDRHPAPGGYELTAVGHAAADGIQALLVEVDGTSTREDGGRYHLTLTLADGRQPAEARHLIERITPTALPTPIPLTTTPF